MNSLNLLTIFTTGLLAGGLTCMAVQGGLFSATIAQVEQKRLEEKLKKRGNASSIVSFLIGKLIAYTVVGAILGYIGSLFLFSLTAQIILQIAVVIFMLFTAFHLLKIHPFFSCVVIKPPRFVHNKNVFTPFIMGVITVFIPCGTTQAMMALSVSSASPLLGALILFIFTLGTSPVFFVLGYFATYLGSVWQKMFLKTAAIMIVLFAVFNLNNILALSGSVVTIDGLVKNIWCTVSFCKSPVTTAEIPISDETIGLEPDGYSPAHFTVKTSSQVTIRLVNNSSRGCTQSFVIPKLGIEKVVPLGISERFTFQAPDKPGQLAFMCSSGIYRGVITVI